MEARPGNDANSFRLPGYARLDTAIIVGCGEAFDATTIPYDILEAYLHGGGREGECGDGRSHLSHGSTARLERVTAYFVAPDVTEDTEVTLRAYPMVSTREWYALAETVTVMVMVVMLVVVVGWGGLCVCLCVCVCVCVCHRLSVRGCECLLYIGS